MKIVLLLLCTLLIAVHSYTLATKKDRKLADGTFLKRQEQILSLYRCILHPHHGEHEKFDILSKMDHFEHPEKVKELDEAIKMGMHPPRNGIFTKRCPRTLHDTMLLLDVLYFAKDFDTFFYVASWAKLHLHPVQFSFAFTVALLHREDCQHFTIPPLYEILPNYFAPIETMHEAFDTRMMGVKEGTFLYNNTGYEFDYHRGKSGGPLGRIKHADYKMSYLTEDIGLNNWYAMHNMRFPIWMKTEKYRGTMWYRRGEHFFYKLQQLFALYTLHRLSQGLGYTELLEWDLPIKVGYNPRVAHHNGRPLFARPDNIIPKMHNRRDVDVVMMRELEIFEVMFSEETMKHLNGEERTERYGEMIAGIPHGSDKSHPMTNYYMDSMMALGYLPRIGSEHEFVGTAMSLILTALRDPLYYRYLNRLMRVFEGHKKQLEPYTKEDVMFHGVTVKHFEVDKLVTYFERFEYEITNNIPLKEDEHVDHRYMASAFRLNHKPYNYKITINTENATMTDAMIRVFIGPKYDAEEIEMTYDESRMMFVEIDRFPVKLSMGENILERNSKESPLFSSDPDSFRSVYQKVNKAIKSSEPYYISEEKHYSMPDRFQLPRGWKHGQPFVIAIIVTPQILPYTGDEKDFYAPFGSSKLYDTLPLGFPFDRPVDVRACAVPNIMFKDVLIYHKDDMQMRLAA